MPLLLTAAIDEACGGERPPLPNVLELQRGTNRSLSHRRLGPAGGAEVIAYERVA